MLTMASLGMVNDERRQILARKEGGGTEREKGSESERLMENFLMQTNR